MRMKFFIFSALLLSPLINHCATTAPVVSYFNIRSQAVDTARELAGWTDHVNLWDMESVYGTLAVTTEYTRSFLSNYTAHNLFDTNTKSATLYSTPSITISGSQVINRGPDDWLADYFYLPTDFLSIVNINPRIENVIVDLDFYIGLDEWANGLFFRIDMPINWTRWSLDFKETVSQAGINDYDSGYFNSYDIAPGTPAGGIEGVGIERSKLLANFGEFISGQAPTNITDGTQCNALSFAKMDLHDLGRAKTRLAALSWIIGWNFLEFADYHLGVGLLTRAPTGNRPESIFLFEPISGNGKHWELGAHITSHALLWQSEDDATTFGLYVDANITHLFKTHQTRTFDLKCKPLSRYMLAEKLGTSVSGLAGGITAATAGGTGTTIPNAQFQKEFSPVGNLTTQEVHVSIGVQADIAAQFSYACNGLTIDLGYNLFARSCEKIDLDSDCPSTCLDSCNTGSAVILTQNTWALKGDAYVFGFNIATAPATPVALSATESDATINGGTTFPATGATTFYQGDNAGVDNAQFAFIGVGSATPLYADPAGIDGQTKTSLNPIFIQMSDINLAGSRYISNKIYAHISYNWLECKHWVPYFGIGGYGEFGINSRECSTSSCVTASLSQWGLWFKTGLSFK